MIKTKHLVSILAAAPLFLLPAVAHAGISTGSDLLTNSSFELASATTNLNVNGWHVFPTMYGWNVDPTGGVEVRTNDAGSAEQGKNFIELDTDQRSQYGAGFVKNTNSWISQTVKTTAGKSYTVSFWYAPREDTAANNNGIQLDVDGKLVHTYSGDSSQKGSTWNIDYKVDGNTVGATSGKNDSGNVWKQFSYTFVATGNSSTVKFAATGIADTYGGSLDNVTLTQNVPAVPEPSTYALMALGLGLLAFRGRKMGAFRRFGV